MTNDPNEVLRLIRDFDGAADATMAPGTVSATAMTVGMAPPLRTGDVTKDRAASRLYHSARFTMPDQSCSAESVAAFEAMAAKLPQQQAEARELWFRDHPDQRPEPEHAKEAPPENFSPLSAVYRRDLKRH